MLCLKFLWLIKLQLVASHVVYLISVLICLKLQEEDLLALLREEETAEDKMIQTDISDEDLERMLDRSDLIAGPLSDAEKSDAAAASAMPLKGPGWEVVIPTASGGMLSTLNS